MRMHAAALMLAGCALASDAWPARPAVVGSIIGYPMATVDHNGGAGLYVEMVRAIAAHTKSGLEFRALPFPRLRQYLKQGNVDAVIAVPNAEMLADAEVAGTVMHFDVIALGRSGSQVHAMEQLQGHRICISRSSALVPELYADKRYLLTEVSQHDSCTRMLDAGRVDFVITMRIALPHILATMGKSLADYGEPFLIKRVPVALLVSRKQPDPGLAEALRLALRSAQNSGATEAIERKYLRPLTEWRAPLAAPAM